MTLISVPWKGKTWRYRTNHTNTGLSLALALTEDELLDRPFIGLAVAVQHLSRDSCGAPDQDFVSAVRPWRICTLYATVVDGR